MNGYYWITEWDGTRELVGAEFKRGEVLIKYADGTRHVVSRTYFLESLRASVEPRAA